MKIKKIILENFRCYKERTVIDIDDLTVFIGKNDVGKSTILDALDIFFNEGKGSVKIEKDDLNRQAERDGETNILIGVVFSDLPGSIIIDSRVTVTLEDEYLLNEENYLEIHKVFRNGKLVGTFIIAKHPANDELIKNLLLKPISDLRDYVNEHNLECEDKRKASLLRRSIRNNYQNLIFEIIQIPTDKEGSREIWLKLQGYLPIYALFKSDRTNTDTNTEVQDPLKVAVREVLQKDDIQDKLAQVSEKVKRTITEIANLTLEELKKINPEIARELKPNLPDPAKLKWGDVFKKISFVSEEDIPLNKRGSGVRRLVLLSFFAAEVERRRKENDAVSVVYAIEEPETSQHPDHQKLLINNFIELSKIGNTQILLTTHSSSIAQLLPVESLRLIKIENNKVHVKKGGNTSIIQNIADTMGILPTLSKVVICVEGENDRRFLLNINQNIPELKEIIDLESNHISIIPMNGSNLKSWVERNYLENSGVIEFHLYDRDTNEQYKEAINKVNSRSDLSSGRLTEKREMENYIHKSLIEEEFGITIDDISDWDNEDIPRYLNGKTGNHEKAIKEVLNGKLSSKMTKELFEELGAWNEVKDWFEKIKKLMNQTLTGEAEENVPQT